MTAHARRAVRLLLLAASTLAAAAARPARASEIVVDCAERTGEFRPLHGVNGGPLDRGGLIDLSAFHRELSVPLTRLHDCHWPNPDVVDMHAVFPRPDADPALPGSYDFVRTDAYLRPIVQSGSAIVYRLGQSIEHGPDKRRVRPPADPERWAAACVGIIRHYNEGWADGFRHDVRYWEIWNEPDNRPNCWTGTDEEYFRLYLTAARAIKQRYPHLRVGGPAVGNVGRVEQGTDEGAPSLRPPPFVEKFLDFSRRESAPLDFFSWHLYCNDPAAVAAHARAVRRLLDDRGFAKAESHLNEWNYLPDNDWGPIMANGQGEPRRRFVRRVGGAEGAAFAAAVLLALQDCPLDAANYFSADTGEFGLFDRYGSPRKTCHAFRAFRALLDTPVRVRASWDRPAAGAAAGAGLSRSNDSVAVLVSSIGAEPEPFGIVVKNTPWRGATAYEITLLDETHDLVPVRSGTVEPGGRISVQPFKAPAVALVKLTPSLQGRNK